MCSRRKATEFGSLRGALSRISPTETSGSFGTTPPPALKLLPRLFPSLAPSLPLGNRLPHPRRHNTTLFAQRRRKFIARDLLLAACLALGELPDLHSLDRPVVHNLVLYIRRWPLPHKAYGNKTIHLTAPRPLRISHLATLALITPASRLNLVLYIRRGLLSCKGYGNRTTHLTTPRPLRISHLATVALITPASRPNLVLYFRRWPLPHKAYGRIIHHSRSAPGPILGRVLLLGPSYGCFMFAAA